MAYAFVKYRYIKESEAKITKRANARFSDIERS